MARESFESLRERLLSQHSVQKMIQMRAYEIYQMRGSQPGGEAQDWFHAEREVLAYLIASESEQADEQDLDRQIEQALDQSSEVEVEQITTVLIVSPEEPAPKKPRSRAAKSATSKAASKKQAAPKKSAKSKSKSATVRKKSKAQPSENDTAG